MKIYTVFGAAGEYSDHQEWAIVSYTSEAEARAHVTAADTREREIRIWMEEAGDAQYDDTPEVEAAKKNKYDASRSTWDRNIYYIENTELKEKFEAHP